MQRATSGARSWWERMAVGGAAVALSLVGHAAQAAVAPTPALTQAAQGSEKGAGMLLTPAMRKEVVEGLLRALQERYVFPDVAEKMARSVRERMEKKEYDAPISGPDLARKLTEDLQAASRDKHLHVLFSAEPRPAVEPQTPSIEELKQMRRRAMKQNGSFRRVERLPGNVGCLEFRAFMDPEALEEPLAAAMNFLANTDALIVDLRRNGGGSPAAVALVCSYLFGETPIHLNSLVWREGDRERKEEFWTRKSVAGKRYLDRPVYVLTSSRTFSGAEEFTYNLKTQKRATIVGERTGGGANPGGVHPINAHFAAFIPTGRALNPITQTNWEGTGVAPDVEVPADQAFEKAHQLAVGELMKSAGDVERRWLEEDLEVARRERSSGKGPEPSRPGTSAGTETRPRAGAGAAPERKPGRFQKRSLREQNRVGAPARPTL